MKYTSLSVRIWTGQMDLLKKAAKADKVTVPEFVRKHLMPIASKIAGVPEQEWPSFYRGRHSAQTQAAMALGVPVEEWRKQVLKTVAEATVRQIGSGAPPAMRPPGKRDRV